HCVLLIKSGAPHADTDLGRLPGFWHFGHCERPIVLDSPGGPPILSRFCPELRAARSLRHARGEFRSSASTVEFLLCHLAGVTGSQVTSSSYSARTIQVVTRCLRFIARNHSRVSLSQAPSS